MKKYYKDLSYDEVTEQLTSLEKQHPQYVKIESIGKSDEGRDIWCISFTDHDIAEKEKHGFLLQANVHSVEMTGTSFILYFIENILNNLETHADILRKLVFYCIPRVNPDGAEAALTLGLNNRSKMIATEQLNGFVPDDIDKNGLICQMRWKSREGKFREHPEEPRLMIRRDVNDSKEEEYYHVAEFEGIINNWDGKTIDLDKTGMLFCDFNRNFPSNWIFSANRKNGDYPLCFNETKAIVDFVLSHKNIYMALDLHNGTGAIMYPPAYRNESEYPLEDMEVFSKIFKSCETITGLPAMCAKDYGSSNAVNPRHKIPGHYGDWLYECQGILAAVIEFGYIYQANLGLSAQQWMKELKKNGRPDDKVELRLIEGQDKGGVPIYYPWKRFNHPQIGEVEIGGICKAMYGKLGENNYDRLFKSVLASIVSLSNIYPYIDIVLGKTEISHECCVIHADIINKGYLSTSITKQYREIFLDRKPIVAVNTSSSLTIINGMEKIEIDHMDSGTWNKLSWVVRGNGDFIITFDSDKTGLIRKSIQV